VNRCDAVIVNFNAGAFLTAAVESVLRSPSVAHVYVVDNASIDGSLDLLPRGHDDQLTIIHNSANLGFAAACNIGLTRAVSENILLLNPDCCVMEGAIDCLITVLRSADRVGIVGPLLLNADGSEQAGGRRKLPMPSLVVARTIGATKVHRILPFAVPDFLLHKHPLPEGPVETEAISGACMMVRREMIADVGPLDEEYFLHCEDLDWCMRVWRRGWKILFVPEARVVHHKGISSQTRPLTVEWHKHIGMMRFYRKLLGQTRPRWFLTLLAAGVWTRFGAIAGLHLLARGTNRIRSVCRWTS
jgi:GT2 family glycosyltransferase